MNWNVIASLVSPTTGIMFSRVQTAKNLQLIIWCKGTYFLRYGDVVTTGFSGLYVNGARKDLNVINASPYNLELWSELQKKTLCPANLKQVKSASCCSVECQLEKCPFDTLSRRKNLHEKTNNCE